MNILASIMKGVHSFKKAMKLAKSTANKGRAMGKAIKDTVIVYGIASFFTIAIIGGGLYSITGAIGDAFSWLTNKLIPGQSYEDYVDSMSEEDLKALEDATGAYFNPKKLKGYMKEERESVPSSINGTQHINNNGAKSSKNVDVNISDYAEKYKTNWEFIAAVDIAIFEGGESDKVNVLNYAKKLRSVFTWTKDKYYYDKTDFKKEWVEVTEHDSSTGGTTMNSTESQASEKFYEVNTPLAIPEKVVHPFGTDIYEVQENILLKKKEWSNPTVTSSSTRTESRPDRLVDNPNKPIYDEDGKIKGYEQIMSYKTITITTKNVQITAQEIFEDKVKNIKSNFEPSKFIKFINDSGLSVKDLDLIKEVMVNIPNGNYYLNIIDQIIKGGYGDLVDGSTGGTGGGGANGGSLSGVLPLYLQWDAKWGSQPYANETIAQAGCAPTTMAMVITGLGGKVDNGMDLNGDGILDPSESAKYATSKGHAAPNQGSYNTIVGGMASDSGLTATPTMNIEEVYAALKTGKVVVANVVPGTIIRGFHFLVLTGVDNKGLMTMNDPNSKENSDKGWNKGVLAREAQAFWIIDNPNLDKTSRFAMKIRMGAIENYIQYNVFPSITMAQGALESGWGESTLATLASNIYGVKAHSSWTGPTIDLPTKEQLSDGTEYIVMAKWRVFSSWAESTLNHGVFLNENPTYASNGVFSAKDYKEQAHALRRAGYATDIKYPQKLIDLIEDFNFQAYDEIAKKMKN